MGRLGVCEKVIEQGSGRYPFLSSRSSLEMCEDRPSYGTSIQKSGDCTHPLLQAPSAVVSAAPPDGGSKQLRWRVLGATSVLALFTLGVCIASTRRTPEEARYGFQDTFATGRDLNLRARLPPGLEVSDSLATLTVTATNEYGQYDAASLALYGLDMVVEPYRDTLLEARGSFASSGSMFRWTVVEADSTGAPTDDAQPVLSVVGGRSVPVTLTKPGSIFLLTVEERTPDETLVATGTVSVSCKYVRRELRDLTDADREDFLDALHTYYTLTDAEGKAKYGSSYFDYKRLAAYHNAASTYFCYHGGLQFLTSHPAFNLMLEQSLQAINPRVSLPFWDYMLDSAELGNGWADSRIFADDMFGRATGNAEESYMLTEGRFAGIDTIYDPDNSLVDSRIHTNHNAFGYVSATHNFQDVPWLTRTSSFCGLEANDVFANVDVFLACFDDYDTLSDWESCMESKVHGNMHGLLGGAFNCNTDMQVFHREHPEYSSGLLTFLLEYLTTNKWQHNSFMPDYNDCDTDCDRGQTESCGCTCLIDAFEIPEDMVRPLWQECLHAVGVKGVQALVYSLTSGFLSWLSEKYNGESYISYDGKSARPWGLLQNGVRLDDDVTMLLLRYLVKIGCEPAAVGLMAVGTSTMDPLFWVLHPMFEKAMHVLWLSSKYKDSYDFEWEAGICTGSALHDSLPFTEKALGIGAGTEYLTNEDLMTILHPSNGYLPYVYEKFSQWGDLLDWDFCPECLDAARAAQRVPST